MRVLLLGGTSEATVLADMLAAEPGIDAILSLAGMTARPRRSPLPVRSGGFGGVDGLRAFLCRERIDAVIDATHPFAARISRSANFAAAAVDVPLLRVSRPSWSPEPGDHWIDVADATAAALALGSPPRRVLLTVGRRDLLPFRDLAPQHDYLVRSIEPPDPALLPPRSRMLLERGPFDEPHERRLLRDGTIEIVVAKNSGGDAVAAKLTAARILHLPVVMVRRPLSDLPGDVVPGPEAASSWLRALFRSHQTSPIRRGV